MYQINNTPSDPSGYDNIGYYVNLTPIGGSQSVDINVTYQDSDLGSLDENTLVMYEYNESTSTWTKATGDTEVDTTNNVVYWNSVTVSSLYGRQLSHGLV